MATPLASSGVFGTPPPGVTAVIVHHRTPDLVEQAVRSLRRYYPALPLLLVDNGSGVEAVKVLENLRDTLGGPTELILHPTNLHHGPAMDLVLRQPGTPFVLFVDTDCVFLQGGLVEKLLTLLESDPQGYAAGHMVQMDRRGYEVPNSLLGIPYIRPYCMLICRELYRGLPPFLRHGTPCLENMAEAGRRGLLLINFPIWEFVSHTGRGTAGKYGYHLGLQGKLNELLHRLGL